jgi:hypothetical protein
VAITTRPAPEAGELDRRVDHPAAKAAALAHQPKPPGLSRSAPGAALARGPYAWDTIDEAAFGVTLKGAFPGGNLADAVAAWRDDGGTIELDITTRCWR